MYIFWLRRQERNADCRPCSMDRKPNVTFLQEKITVYSGMEHFCENLFPDASHPYAIINKRRQRNRMNMVSILLRRLLAFLNLCFSYMYYHFYCASCLGALYRRDGT
jgi:hypothetical protein